MNVRRLTSAWLLLVAMTALYGWWGHELRGGMTFLEGLVILGVAFVKLRIVIYEFMGIRTAPRPLRRACDVWLVLTAAALIGLLWTGSSPAA